MIEENEILENENLNKSYTYDILNRRETCTDALRNVTKSVYDDFGREIQTLLPSYISAEGTLVQPIIHKQYNVLGQLIAVTDPKGYTTKTQYNIRGKPTVIDYPDGTREGILITSMEP